ncbi:bifunctional DNA primase/polymerase [Chloroflexota bacterium]
MVEFLVIALNEARQGRPVFPCRGKLPATKHGVKDASLDEATIREWAKQYPDANVGVAFNKDTAEVGLDLDKDNLPSWLEAKRPPVATRKVKTGGGGFHFYFLRPAGVDLPNIPKSRGFELKSVNQYLLAPGSIHPDTGLPYELVDDSPPTPMPDWLIELALSNNGGKPATATGKFILKGERNTTLASIAGTMRGRGMPESAIKAALLEVNAIQCQPPLPESDIEKIAGSIAKYPPTAQKTPSLKEAPLELQIPRPVVKTLSAVEAENITWLWYPYLPLGKLSLLEGDPGVGKSWVCLALATAVSLGERLPMQDETLSGPVLIASAEDGIADTIKPRIAAMGANQSIIHAIDGLLTLDIPGFEMLESYIADTVPALLIIDPLVAYLSGDMDINKANQVRFATARLAALADKYGMAIVAVRHLTKGGSQKAIYRGLGSIDFTAAARSVLFAGADPENESNRAIDHIKHNLSPKGAPVGYELRDGQLFWRETTDLTYERMTAFTESKGAIDEAKEFILDALSDGEALATEMMKDAKERGISDHTLRRARESLSVEIYRQGEPGKRGGGKSFWRLPQ